MRRLSEVDETNDSLFSNAHGFYHAALKPGAQLDSLTTKFLHYLQEVLDDFEANQRSEDISLFNWARTIVITASTNALMGPALLRNNPDLLSSVWLVEGGFFLFINRIPRMFAKKHYRARDRVHAAFASYFSDEKNRAEGAPAIWDREIQLRAKGMTTRDIAAYSYSFYAVSTSPSVCTTKLNIIPLF